MAARGTRRPHPKRVYRKPRVRVSKAAKKGCLLIVLALPGLAAVAAAVERTLS